MTAGVCTTALLYIDAAAVVLQCHEPSGVSSGLSSIRSHELRIIQHVLSVNETLSADDLSCMPAGMFV